MSRENSIKASSQIAMDLIALGLRSLTREGEVSPADSASMIELLESPAMTVKKKRDAEHDKAYAKLKDAVDWHFAENSRTISFETKSDGAESWFATDERVHDDPRPTLGPFSTASKAVMACYLEQPEEK